jgi:integrase/recombinase XerD
MPRDDNHSEIPYRSTIKGIFVHRDAIERHLNTPYLAEREAYLSSLVAFGHTRAHVAEKATMLRQVVRIIDCSTRKEISEIDILEGSQQWSNERLSTGKPCSPRHGDPFRATARSWYEFLGMYNPHPRPFCRFRNMYDEFLVAMEGELGYLPTTVYALGMPTRRFLEWASARHEALSEINLTTIDIFIRGGRAKGWAERTIKGICEALRTFFRYAERRGWNSRGLSGSIKAPLSSGFAPHPYSPPWKSIRKLLSSLRDSIPSECRAKAIVLLASVYGMRSCEISRLTFEDIDWYNEILTIRRAKRGRVQQFPLSYEVGQSIINYLQKGRPQSRLRNVFITQKGPSQPINHMSQSVWRLFRTGNFFDRPCGLHSLRHACATELLRKGTSLRAIADFLGHRDIRCVSIYARCDFRSLRAVATFELKEVI